MPRASSPMATVCCFAADFQERWPVDIQIGPNLMCFKVFVACAALLSGTLAAAAQTVPGQPHQGRDCQTVRTCNFARGATVRGCLSSYSCRSCRFVAADCVVGSGQGTCQRLRCSWNG